jgi:hypothetical protein
MRVGGYVIGITALQDALEEAAREYLAADDTTAGSLVSRLRAHTYIPVDAEPRYRQALLRE